MDTECELCGHDIHQSGVFLCTYCTAEAAEAAAATRTAEDRYDDGFTRHE